MMELKWKRVQRRAKLGFEELKQWMNMRNLQEYEFTCWSLDFDELDFKSWSWRTWNPDFELFALWLVAWPSKQVESQDWKKPKGISSQFVDFEEFSKEIADRINRNVVDWVNWVQTAFEKYSDAISKEKATWIQSDFQRETQPKKYGEITFENGKNENTTGRTLNPVN